MHLNRNGLALVALALAVVGLLAPGAPSLLVEIRADDFPTAGLAVATSLLLATASWIVVVAGMGALGTSSRVLRLVAPRCVRQALFLGVAGAMVASPAQADRAAPVGAQHAVDGLPLPDRPTAGRPAAASLQPAAVPPRAHAPAHHVVVRRGDTLWSIARRSLPADATPAEVAAACDRWHAANRAVIGDDPDLIFPHQRLTPPGKDQP